MRRAFRRLTVGAAATSVALLLLPPAFAEGGVDLDQGDDGGSANVKVEVKDPGSGGNKSFGGGGSSSGGDGRASVGSDGKSSGSGGGKTSVSNGSSTSVIPGARTRTDNYSSGTAIPKWEQSGADDAARGAALDAGVTKYTDEDDITWANSGQISGVGPYADGWDQMPQLEVPSEAIHDREAISEDEIEPQVDPAELAQTAISRMRLEAPEIASTPNDTETLGAVGLPVWLWVANPGETTTGPNATSASAGAVTVTAAAEFSGMSIDMGDGTTIECEGPGTEYPGTGVDPPPDCGHAYEQMSEDQPDGLYTVNITAHWRVKWESNVGETGTIPVELTTSKQLRIGQYQTVVTDVS